MIIFENSSMTNLIFPPFAVIDAWGKPPSGILRGRFKWPGEMNECVRIKADRRRVQPDGTIISGKDAIRGGWTMVGIKLSALGGIGGEQVCVEISQERH